MRRDAYVVGHRWWNPSELQASNEDFAPRRLAALVAHIIEGQYPAEPIDVGV
jgi:hypothetical protein